MLEEHPDPDTDGVGCVAAGAVVVGAEAVPLSSLPLEPLTNKV